MNEHEPSQTTLYQLTDYRTGLLWQIIASHHMIMHRVLLGGNPPL